MTYPGQWPFEPDDFVPPKVDNFVIAVIVAEIRDPIRLNAVDRVQGYLTHKRKKSSWDPTVGLYLGSSGGPKEGGLFLMSEVPL